MTRYSLLIIFFMVVFGCIKKHKKISKHYKDGTIEREYFIDENSLKQGESTTYFPNGRIDIKGVYRNGDYKDTLYYYNNDKENAISSQRVFYDNGSNFYKDFYRNGSVRQVGVFDQNDQRIGIWKNYDDRGNLHFVKEYKAIDGKEYTNQLWVLLPSGDTLNDGVNIRYQFSKNKLQVTDSIYGFFQTDVSAFEDNAKTTVSVTLPKDYTQDNFRADFSNRAKDLEEKGGIPVMEIPSLNHQEKPIAHPKPLDTLVYNKTVAFYWKPQRKGKDTIRGFFKEEKSFFDKSLPENKTTEAILTILDKKTYFEFPVEVE